MEYGCGYKVVEHVYRYDEKVRNVWRMFGNIGNVENVWKAAMYSIMVTVMNVDYESIE